MWAMIVKEFRQLRRDRRTLAMMIVLPVLLLVVFGYAASFDVTTIPAVVAGPLARELPLGAPFQVVARAPDQGAAWAQQQLRDNRDGAAVAVVTGGRTLVLVDGSQLFSARAALTALDAAARRLPAAQVPVVRILYNPELKTSYIMIPGLAGVVLVFVGVIITSLGVVRERQTGTLEQLAVMPLRPRDVFLGKIVPYFAVAAVDLAIVLAVGVALFGVPFRGSYAVFGLGALLFLFVTLGIGVLISSVSENQGQAIQLSIMFTLPQVLLSGLIFPLSSIAAGVRWISYLLPLTYFNQISRGVMLRAEPIGPLWQPFVALAVLGLIVMSLAMLRFRRYLSPAARPGAGAAGPRHRPRPCQRRQAPGERGPPHRGTAMSAAPAPAPAPAAAWWGTEAVSVRYGSVTALAEVTFRAWPGQVSAVVGGDGAGRTTLLRCLAGALAPSGGTVRRPPRRSVGYLPSGSGIYPDLTVAENLAFRAAAYRVPAAVAAARTDGYLERAGLLGARHRLAGQLSGGMRQKLGVISAMLPQPALLVLDEPTTGVDPVSRADLWWLITRAAAGGAAVVIATSYLDEAERAAAVLVLDGGHALAAGSPEDIVAAMPGTLRASDARPAGAAGERAWRRDARWRAWYPDGSAPGGGEPLQPDLQDAVTVAILARDLAGTASRGGAAAPPGGRAAAAGGAR